jgi:hypothetical protein
MISEIRKGVKWRRAQLRTRPFGGQYTRPAGRIVSAGGTQGAGVRTGIASTPAGAGHHADAI